ncbi:KDEL motif protein [Nile crocodilepox virus]|uniref:KDEL motif protein n=1 Tax=Nile crocodilepox virus (isolate Crocodylus niloticus/Zimbabwe/Ume/2001) TaxID=1289473 RepID=Q06ZY6_CPRVZ|nr:KDEL motif protein [Nile crocodilepox virus]ABJ09056.1 KDEL motif protein [Nile crocodilepox virus]
MLSRTLFHLAAFAVELAIVYYLVSLPCRDVSQEKTRDACCSDEQRARCPIKIQPSGCWLYKHMPMDLLYVVGDVLSVVTRWDPHDKGSELMIRLYPNASFNAPSSTVRLQRPPSPLGHYQIVSLRRPDFENYYAFTVATQPTMYFLQVISCPNVEAMISYLEDLRLKIGRRMILQAIYDDSTKRLRSSTLGDPYAASGFSNDGEHDKHYAYVGSEESDTETQRGVLNIPTHQEL